MAAISCDIMQALGTWIFRVMSSPPSGELSMEYPVTPLICFSPKETKIRPSSRLIAIGSGVIYYSSIAILLSFYFYEIILSLKLDSVNTEVRFQVYTPKESAELIEKLVKKRGANTKTMLIECGLSERVISNMKAGSMPSADKMATIASYLAVSSNFLLGIEKPATPEREQPALTEHQRLVQEVIDRAQGKSREALLAIIGMMDHIENQSSQ